MLGEGSSYPTMRNSNTSVRDPTAEDQIATLVAKNPVVIFSISTCLMCHSIKEQFRSQAAKVYELDQYPTQWRKEIERALIEKNGSIPVVYIGGKLVGNKTQVMSSHIHGELDPLLEFARVL